jgi:hypothetical protein
MQFQEKKIIRVASAVFYATKCDRGYQVIDQHGNDIGTFESLVAVLAHFERRYPGQQIGVC